MARATLSKGFSDWGEIIRIISHRQISVFLYLLDSYWTHGGWFQSYFVDWALKSERLKGEQVEIFVHSWLSTSESCTRGVRSEQIGLLYSRTLVQPRRSANFQISCVSWNFWESTITIFVDLSFNRFLLWFQLNIIDKSLKIPNPTQGQHFPKGSRIGEKLLELFLIAKYPYFVIY